MHNIEIYNHFKFKSLQDVFKIIQPNCWMASVDLKDAFYSVPIIKDHQKYLKFQWLEEIYIFLRVSNWYSEAMHIFPKPKNPSFGLWKQELLRVTLVDDSYLQGATKEQCNQNVNATINLLTSLGFTIHTKKVSSIRWIFRFCYRQKIIQKKSASSSWMLPFLFFFFFFFKNFILIWKCQKWSLNRDTLVSSTAIYHTKCLLPFCCSSGRCPMILVYSLIDSTTMSVKINTVKSKINLNKFKLSLAIYILK